MFMVRSALALFLSISLLALPAWAEDADRYPSQPIKMIVCVPAGGGVDTVTRIVAEKVRQQLGQPVVVENRGGQAGNLGAEAVFAATPDGYTLLASQPAPLTVNALLYRKLNYDPQAFIPITVMTAIPNVLAVRADFPAHTIKEFIDYARAHPGNSTTPRKAPARPRISRPNCSRARPARNSSTCPTRARRPPSTT
jgi:tripartite-type tricarboxylate transporter receptor subunit TctC